MVKQYEIIIRATVTKTLNVNAESLDEAEGIAHEMFTLAADEWPEDYEQETMRVEKIS